MDILNMLKGYKSIIGCVAAIATFVLLVCNQLADGFQFSDVQNIMGGFSALMLALGLTGKAIDIQNSLKK
jgi:hypothetical protein